MLICPLFPITWEDCQKVEDEICTGYLLYCFLEEYVAPLPIHSSSTNFAYIRRVVYANLLFIVRGRNLRAGACCR
jgi:hypothetical protein